MDVTFTNDDAPGVAPSEAIGQDDAQAAADEFAEQAADEQARADESLLKEAKEWIKFSAEAEKDIRELFVDDLKFLAGDHWPAELKQERMEDGRPCLTINRLPQFVQQVANDQRQNRPSIRVSPKDHDSSEETAEVIEGLLRDIQNNSNAEVAYDTAFDSAAGPGLGYFRLLPSYVSPESFDQEILIERIRNPLSVYFDPYSQKPDGSDAERAAITDDLSRAEFLRQHPQSKLAAPGTDWQNLGNEEPDWIQTDGVRIAEYFYKEYTDIRIHQLANGETVKDEDLAARQMAAVANNVDCRVIKSRTAKKPVVKWIKISAVEILDRGELPGTHVPIIPVYGQEIFLNGKRILKGIVRDAKDAQRMYDFWASAETEAIALAPRAPWVGAEGQFEGHEDKWETANRKNHAYLEYKPTDLDGRPSPPPQRVVVEPAVQAITQARMMSADDLKATTGVYEAGQGAQGNEVSGVAIQRRTTQIGTANFHLVENLKHSMRHAGRILVEWIPIIYDAARAVRVVGDDGSQKIVHINQPTKNEAGEAVLYTFSEGRYDVVVDVGPSFASKRQEAAASMMDFSRAVPQVAQFCADLIARNMDWPGAQEISDRLKLALPPQLQQNPKQAKIPPQVQGQMQQMQAVIRQLTDHLNETTKIIETKKMDLDHRERIEILKLQTEAELKMAELGSKGNIALLSAKMKEMEHRLQLLGMNQPIDAPQDFNPQQADGGNYAGFGHVGSGPTGGPQAPGQPMGDTP